MISLNNSELWFLFKQFSPLVILGFDNPVKGMLKDDIQHYNQKAVSSLVNHDFIRLVDNNEIIINEVILQWIKSIVNSDDVVIAYNSRTYTFPIAFYFSEKHLISLQQIDEDNYELKSFGNHSHGMEWIKNQIPKYQFKGTSKYHLLFTKDLFVDVLELVHKNKLAEASSLFEPMTQNDTASECFWTTLCNAELELKLSFFRHQNDEKKFAAQQLMYIGDKEHLWEIVLKSFPENSVQVNSITYEKLQSKISSLYPV